jgi:beta-glucanase (GH16 family)
MKKRLKFCSGFVFFLALLLACQEEEPTITNLIAPSNLQVNVIVAEDQSGNVTVTPNAENAINFHVIFNPGADPVVISNGQSANFRYTTSGQFEQPISVVAFGQGGLSSSATVMVDLDVSLRIAPEVLAMIAGGDGISASSKRWVWNRIVGGHFGVGPLTNDFPEFFSASPNQLNPCLYDDVLIFSHDGNDNYTFTLDPGPDNLSFINWTEVNRFFPDATPQQFADECRDITDQVDFETNFVILDNEDGTKTMDVTGSFLSYWAVISGQYQITNFNENILELRGISEPFNGDGSLAWYSAFVPEENANAGGEALETVFTNLVWADEFDMNGAPNPMNWNYDLGGGGFGNQEKQVYTQDPENVLVEDGLLRITAISNGGPGADVYYYDDFQLVDGSGANAIAIEDFEGDAPQFTGFEGASSEVINNPDPSGSNTSASVAQFTKSAGAAFFAGTFFDLAAPLDFSANSTLAIKTWSPKTGAVVRIKIENTADSSQFTELDATTSVTNQWETLTYDFSNAPNFNYDRIVIFFDFGEEGPLASITSARIKTQDLQEFTYGRAEIRAKLPTGGGTWPALWMLGANFPEVGWPQAGEMDIMEHVGNQQDIIFGTTHDPDNFGGNARTGSTLVEGVSEEFHVYEMEWTETEIQFAVDGQVYHTVSNDAGKPFNEDFFFIMNVAMGGTFGGSIDPNFESSAMEVDYIRFFQ